MSLPQSVNPNPSAPTAPSAWSRFESRHHALWAFLVGFGLLSALAFGFIKGLAEVGGRPTTPESQGYLLGAILSPLILALIGVAIYYRFRKTHRTSRRMVSAWVGWTLLLSALSFMGALGRLARSPHFPSDEKELRGMMGQAYKEASGTVPPEQYSSDEMVVTMRKIFRDIIQFNQQYQKAMAQFQTAEMGDLFTASSFRDKKTIEETVRQLRGMESVEQRFSSLDSILAKIEARLELKDWPDRTKRDFLVGFRESLAQNTQSRRAVFQIEQKWIDASVDLYSFAENNSGELSVNGNQVVIQDPAARETFNQKLNRAVELHRQAEEAQKQYDEARAANAKRYGLAPTD